MEGGTSGRGEKGRERRKAAVISQIATADIIKPSRITKKKETEKEGQVSLTMSTNSGKGFSFSPILIDEPTASSSSKEVTDRQNRMTKKPKRRIISKKVPLKETSEGSSSSSSDEDVINETQFVPETPAAASGPSHPKKKRMEPYKGMLGSLIKSPGKKLMENPAPVEPSDSLIIQQEKTFNIRSTRSRTKQLSAQQGHQTQGQGLSQESVSFIHEVKGATNLKVPPKIKGHLNNADAETLPILESMTMLPLSETQMPRGGDEEPPPVIDLEVPSSSEENSEEEEEDKAELSALVGGAKEREGDDTLTNQNASEEEESEEDEDERVVETPPISEDEEEEKAVGLAVAGAMGVEIQGQRTQAQAQKPQLPNIPTLFNFSQLAGSSQGSFTFGMAPSQDLFASSQRISNTSNNSPVLPFLPPTLKELKNIAAQNKSYDADKEEASVEVSINSSKNEIDESTTSFEEDAPVVVSASKSIASGSAASLPVPNMAVVVTNKAKRALEENLEKDFKENENDDEDALKSEASGPRKGATSKNTLQRMNSEIISQPSKRAKKSVVFSSQEAPRTLTGGGRNKLLIRPASPFVKTRQLFKQTNQKRRLNTQNGPFAQPERNPFSCMAKVSSFPKDQASSFAVENSGIRASFVNLEISPPQCVSLASQRSKVKIVASPDNSQQPKVLTSSKTLQRVITTDLSGRMRDSGDFIIASVEMDAALAAGVKAPAVDDPRDDEQESELNLTGLEDPADVFVSSLSYSNPDIIYKLAYPELKNCKDHITQQLLISLCTSASVSLLEKAVRAKEVKTVGDLCSLTVWNIKEMPFASIVLPDGRKLDRHESFKRVMEDYAKKFYPKVLEKNDDSGVMNESESNDASRNENPAPSTSLAARKEDAAAKKRQEDLQAQANVQSLGITTELENSLLHQEVQNSSGIEERDDVFEPQRSQASSGSGQRVADVGVRVNSQSQEGQRLGLAVDSKLFDSFMFVCQLKNYLKNDTGGGPGLLVDFLMNDLAVQKLFLERMAQGEGGPLMAFAKEILQNKLTRVQKREILHSLADSI